jgi:hypothetical protein
LEPNVGLDKQKRHLPSAGQRLEYQKETTECSMVMMMKRGQWRNFQELGNTLLDLSGRPNSKKRPDPMLEGFLAKLDLPLYAPEAWEKD